jgi:hypothetical protein
MQIVRDIGSRSNCSFSARRLAWVARVYYFRAMKTLRVTLPDELVADVRAESKLRQRSISDVVRERLNYTLPGNGKSVRLRSIAHLLGSVKGLPRDLSSRKDVYLANTGFGRKHSR